MAQAAVDRPSRNSNGITSCDFFLRVAIEFHPRRVDRIAGIDEPGIMMRPKSSSSANPP